MERKLRKLSAEEIAELKKYDSERLTEEELRKVSGGTISYTGSPPSCPWCGGDMEESTYLIQGGWGAGRLAVYLICTGCGYEEYWGEW